MNSEANQPRPDPVGPAEIPSVRAAAPARGSRSARMSHPTILNALRQLAAKEGVCVNPQALRRRDLASDQEDVIDLPCRATRESKCPPCARRAKRLREQQARQGWHREDEPAAEPVANAEQIAMLETRANLEYARADALARGEWHHIPDLDEGIAEFDQLIRASGLRGRLVAPQDSVTPEVSAIDGEPIAEVSTVDSEALPEVDGSDSHNARAESARRRVRSTRRRQDAPKLPRQKVAARTIGRTFTAPNGNVYRPSTFVTLTLPSYGRVRDDGSPVDPSTYDYRRAAWDAVHFPALLDRLWQNLRRAVGWNVQYFGSVEPQRRLAPHAHFAVRGSIPRATIKVVIRATYHQVWWPSTSVVRYWETDTQPVWDDDAQTYRDPSTGDALPTWDEALDALDDQLDADPDRGPEHVVHFGEQANLQGVLAGTAQADRLVRYLSKYLTKSVSECHQGNTPTAIDHHRRLFEELRYTPCSAACPNWLRYGVQPKGGRAKAPQGFCRAKVHQWDTLGLGGRRVLVSRQWSGKTLADHRYDQLLWVRNLLRVARGVDDTIDDETAERIETARQGGAPSPVAWSLARPGDPGVPDLARRLMRSIATRQRHRAAIDAARAANPPDRPPELDGDG